MIKKVYIFLLLLVVSIITWRFINLRYDKHDYYFNEYLTLTNKIVYGNEAPRGKILDRTGKILVDNVGSNTVFFRYLDNVDINDIVIFLTNNLTNLKLSTNEEEIEYYIKNNNVDELLTEEERSLFDHRKITIEQRDDLIKERAQEYIGYTDEEKKKIHLLSLLKKGYSYSNKIIAQDINEKECANINEANIIGLSCEQVPKRVYLYDTMNAIYGTVGEISKENKDYYLSKGYSLDDIVGISYLEKEYDKYLKGEKAIYQVNNDNTLSLIKSSQKGKDIILSIDIDLQLKINEIIKKNIELSESMKNTKYYNTSYVIVSDPNSGEILASTAIQKINGTFNDVTSNILTNSFTVGSVIKGASHTVAYQNNLIEVGKKINDSCVKLYQTPTKCSYKRLGNIDDVTALKTSSNYYQFINAIKLTGNNYSYNMKINATDEHFNTYRNTFALFGLGVKTGIDLENESIGIKGKTIADDLLLNLSIGQYDAYTPLQLTNYINTIATSGKRYSLHYLKHVKDNEKLVYTYEPTVLSNITDNWYFDRIKEGFKEVLYTGTGRGYTDLKYKPAGKTGTSEVVISPDITAINQSYAMFAPYDDPKLSIVVVSPNISYNNDRDNYIAPINRLISKEVSELVFNWKI